MTYRDFRKIFKGKIVSVRDNKQFYSLEQELEIADREVEKITNDEDGVYVLLVKDDTIRVDDSLNLCHEDDIRVYVTKWKATTRLSTIEAMIEFCNYKVTDYFVYDGYLIISVKPM